MLGSALVLRTLQTLRSPLQKLPHCYRPFYRSFQGLHAHQHEAIAPLMAGQDLLLQAPTGAGKTEAVLAPILERLIQGGRQSSAIYIVPTRALAGDLRRRLSTPLKELSLRLALRTGDSRWRGGALPHLLITTPESLDVLLGSPNSDVRALMMQIQSFIIDEAHIFVGQPRGSHLSLLLKRLQRRQAQRIQRVALSATLAAAPEVIQQFGLDPQTVLLADARQRPIEARLVLLKEQHELISLLRDLNGHFGHKKLLVFVNRRSLCDQLFQLIQGQVDFHCHLHYSNIDLEQRQRVEREFRAQHQALCIATSTLELGIDIGDVDGVLLIEPPNSVASFLQRVGRANRRGGRAQLWGICLGRASELQLLRFRALLRLAREARFEGRPACHLPSVQAQQIVSCLYEKRKLSLESLQDLWPEAKRQLEEIIPLMLDRRWLRQDELGRLSAGGVFMFHLKKQRIFSNFPVQERELRLRVGDEVIADLPQSVIQQLELGDRVYLIGRRLQILEINEERGFVLAKLCQQPESKQIRWFGSGRLFSWDIGQAERALLLEPEDPNEELKLFRRPQVTWEQLRQRLIRAIPLENGLYLERLSTGLYRYWSFLGSLGNFILRESLQERSPELEISHDEAGLNCSELISFEELPLPNSRADFRAWLLGRKSRLRSICSLNAFSRLLGPKLLSEEIELLLFEPQLSKAFLRLKEQPIKLNSEMLQKLELGGADKLPWAPQALAQLPPYTEALSPWLASWSEQLCPPPSSAPRRSLAVSQLANFIKRRGCARALQREHFRLLSPSAPQGFLDVQKALQEQAHSQGREAEAQIMAQLQQRGEPIIQLSSLSLDGQLLPRPQRLEMSLEALREAMRLLQEKELHQVWIAQGFLTSPGPDPRWSLRGIPDLMALRLNLQGALEISLAEIKASGSQGYAQRWQLAAYDRILRSCLEREPGLEKLKRASEAILLRPGEAQPLEERFALRPYRAAWPALLARVIGLLEAPDQGGHQLGRHCSACRFLPCCYPEALHGRELRLAFQLGRGLQAWLERQELLSVEAAWSSEIREQLPLPKQERLKWSLLALREGQALLIKEENWALPQPHSPIFWQGAQDPFSYTLIALGWSRGSAQRIFERASVNSEAQLWEQACRALAQIWAEEELPILFVATSEQARQIQEQREREPEHWSFLPEDEEPQVLLNLFRDHLLLPLLGSWSLNSLGALLSLEPKLRQGLSLLHQPPRGSLEEELLLQERLWAWLRPHLRFPRPPLHIERSPSATAARWIRFIYNERDLQLLRGLEIQRRPLAQRIVEGHTLGPLKLSHGDLSRDGEVLSCFELLEPCPSIRYRPGDFLILAPLGLEDLQLGIPVILEEEALHEGRVCLSIRSRRERPRPGQRYTLERDLTDWTSVKIEAAIRAAFEFDPPRTLITWLQGEAPEPLDPEELKWLGRWLWLEQCTFQLNARQREAFELVFRSPLALIEGPPGTGKTWLLAWIIIALLDQAHARKQPLRIAVTALTHNAVDTLLHRFQKHQGQMRGRRATPCFKWGRPARQLEERVPSLDDPEFLKEQPRVVLGATGFGLHRLSHQLNHPFDLLICDEASQMRLPEALLGINCARGRALFVGDTQQLPPISLSQTSGRGMDPRRSILKHLKAQAPQRCAIRLNQSHRMNSVLCALPSQLWYEGELQPAPAAKDRRLKLQDLEPEPLDIFLNPEQPVSLILLEHEGCIQEAPEEAALSARLVERLYQRGLSSEQIAIISPHRVHNHSILSALRERAKAEEDAFPIIDTVERMQGREADCVILNFVASDLEHVGSDFINDPHRLNVALSRARSKLIVLGSCALFDQLPAGVQELRRHFPLKALLLSCQERGALFRESLEPSERVGRQ